MYILYSHPESNSMFWSDHETKGDGLLCEVGRSDEATTRKAIELYYSNAVEGLEHKMPNFDSWNFNNTILRKHESN